MASTKNITLVEKLCVVFDDNDKLSAVCESIASDIEGGALKLFEVVEGLREFLTSKDASIRENGVHSLSTILSKISLNFLNEQELQLMTSFYCDRLNDHHSIIPVVIRGILAIVQMKNLSNDAPSELFHILFRNVRCQSELQETRRNIYLIFQTLLSRRLESLKLMGPDFIYGFISSMDGESDPRNLMLLFEFLPSLLKECNLYHLIEEMFEVIACYFPVDFNSSTKEGMEITRDDLADALELCLSAIPEFAEYCIPLIIEKLTTSFKIAKKDSLRLLAQSSIVFGVKGLENHLDDLWPLIRKEVLPGNDQELKEHGLKTITAITKVISENDIILVKFIDKIIADTRTSLCDVQLSLYWPAEKLVEAVGKANDKACRQVLKTIVALCLAQYTTNISKIDRISLIETLNSFMAIYTRFDLNVSDISELSWTDLTLLYLNEVSSIKNEDELKAKLIDGLAIQEMSLTEFHRQTLYKEICDEIDRGNDTTRHSCQSILITFAKLYPNEVVNIVNERLLFDGVEIAVLKNRIEALAMTARISCLGSMILPILVELSIYSPVKEIRFISLNSIKKLLMSQKMEYNIHYFMYSKCNIIDKMLCSNFEDGSMRKNNELHLVLNIFCLIIRKLTTDHQRNVVEKHFNLLKVNIVEKILLWEGLLTPLLPCNITQEIVDLFLSFMDISLHNINEDTRLSSCRLSAVIINKINDNNTLQTFLNMVQEEIRRILNDDEENMLHKQAAIVFHVWITKSLISRGNKESQNFLDYQLNLLRHESSIGDFTGEQFRIFVDKSENTLIEDNFCIIKIFHKQRVFETIIRHNEIFIGNSRQNYLIALIHLVEEMPIELLFMHLITLVPLLIESLSLNNGQLILSTLKTLKLLLDTKNDIFLEHIQSFITRCLKLTTHPKMNVRIAALHCLNSYCNYSTAPIKPYKDNVLEKLSETIDDRKRLVRQTAVTTRIRWYLVGAPGVPE